MKESQGILFRTMNDSITKKPLYEKTFHTKESFGCIVVIVRES